MPNAILRFCKPCLVLSVALYVVSLPAVGIGMTSEHGPSWAWVAALAISGLGALLSVGSVMYQKGLERRFGVLETSASATANATRTIETMVLSKYHDVDDIEKLLRPIREEQSAQGKVIRACEMQLASLHIRWDRWDENGTPRQRHTPNPNTGD